MSDEIVTARCNKCKAAKPTSEFHRNASLKRGFSYRCKTCVCEYVHAYRHSKNGRAVNKRWRESNQGIERRAIADAKAAKKRRASAEWRAHVYSIKDPMKAKASQAVWNACAAGKLPKVSTKQCNDCGKTAQEYHHESYLPEYRLIVIPLCRRCHTLRHFPDS